MRRFPTVLLSIFLTLALRAQAPADSLRRLALGAKVDEYVEAIAAYPLTQQQEECDFLIGACADSLERQFVAVRLYDHYLNSRLLGSENVAVHLIDAWFIPGKVKMYDEMDLFNAMVFAEFNRSSLIGAPAPTLELFDAGGAAAAVCPPGGSGRYTLLYFYSPGCATCRLTTGPLTGVAARYAADLDFVAVNTDADRSAWERYLADHPSFRDAALQLWDPELHSDYQRLYGVTQTPQTVLVDPSGTILGRRLDAEALQTLLAREIELYDGELAEEAEQLIATVLGTYGPSPAPDEVMEAHGLISRRTEGSLRTWKALTAALFHYCMTRRGHGLRLAADRLAREEILGRPERWRTETDRLSVLDPAELSVALMDLAPVGERIPRLKVHGTLLHARSASSGAVSSRTGVYRLRRLCGRDHRIVFYSPSCRDCRALLASAGAYAAAHPSVRILLVNMDELSDRYPDEAQAALEALDLSALPMVISTGRGGRVTDKYLDNL